MSWRPILLSVCVTAMAVPAAALEPLTLVTDDSKITFVGAKPDGKHDGGFKKFTADASADFETPKNSRLKIAIDAASLWSDNPKLTNHLKNPDFFDVRKYPEITFESTEIIPGGEGEATIVGKMKMLDKTVEVRIPVKATTDDEQVKLEADFAIDRTKWGMNYGEGKINNDVKIQAVLVFRRP